MEALLGLKSALKNLGAVPRIALPDFTTKPKHQQLSSAVTSKKMPRLQNGFCQKKAAQRA